MKISYWANGQQPWADILTGCQWAETNGWDGIWLPDHFMPVADQANGPGPTDAELGPCLEGWTTLAALAALVPRVRVGLMVGGNTYRHPAIVAKMAATIDHISDGRAVIGIGAGWQVNEHERYGLELGTVAERSDRLEEACILIRRMLTEQRSDFDGDYYQLAGAPAAPKPVQERLPIMVGGGGVRRTLRTVARHADEWNKWGRPHEMAEGVAVLRGWCEDAGRDPAEIHVTAAAFVRICADESEAEERRAAAQHRGGLIGTVDQLRTTVEDYQAAGVDELVIPDFNTPSHRRAELLGRLQDQVLDQFR